MPLDSGISQSLAKGLDDAGGAEGEPEDTDSDARGSEADRDKVGEPGDLTQCRGTKGGSVASEPARLLTPLLPGPWRKDWMTEAERTESLKTPTVMAGAPKVIATMSESPDT